MGWLERSKTETRRQTKPNKKCSLWPIRDILEHDILSRTSDCFNKNTHVTEEDFQATEKAKHQVFYCLKAKVKPQYRLIQKDYTRNIPIETKVFTNIPDTTSILY